MNVQDVNVYYLYFVPHVHAMLRLIVYTVC